jgi:hypothetical protein
MLHISSLYWGLALCLFAQRVLPSRMLWFWSRAVFLAPGVVGGVPLGAAASAIAASGGGNLRIIWFFGVVGMYLSLTWTFVLVNTGVGGGRSRSGRKATVSNAVS